MAALLSPAYSGWGHPRLTMPWVIYNGDLQMFSGMGLHTLGWSLEAPAFMRGE
jgi:hypothetical protein